MFNISDTIKLNEQLCPANKRTEMKFQFGKLGYFVKMLEWEFEVLSSFTHTVHGLMLECKVLNDPNNRSNIVLKADDCVLVDNKGLKKIKYDVISAIPQALPEIEKLKNTVSNLFVVRKQQKLNGIKASQLTENWSEIKSARSSMEKLQKNGIIDYVIRHKSGTYTFACKEVDLKRELIKQITTKRRQQKTLEEVQKTIPNTHLTYSKLKGVLTKSGEFSRMNEVFAKSVIRNEKTPATKDNYVGIEIEMLSPKTVEEMETLFIKARLHKYVNIGDDASIRHDTDGFNRMELRVCLPEHLLESHLKILCDVLRRNDCYANRSCGMHVHVDMRNRDPELCYRNFFKVQNIMLDAQPQTRRKNKYCMPNEASTLTIDQFDDVPRRSVINTNSYNKNDMRTIEIRVHEGATKYRDIINWVKFLVATASLKTELPTVINTIEELDNARYVDTSVLGHLQSRIEEYSA